MVDEIYKRRLMERMKPEAITSNLIRASLFMTAYELLKTEVVHRTIGLFELRDLGSGLKIDLENPRVTGEYRSTVLALDTNKKKNHFKACCLWLAKEAVITDSDVSVLLNIRDHRNKIAHELRGMLLDPESKIDLSLLGEALRLMKTIGRFWLRFQVDSDDEELWPTGSIIMSLLIGAISDQKP